MIASLVLGAPLGLFALGAAVVYLVFARHLVRTERLTVGSLELWREVAKVESRAADGGRITWRTLVLALGLGLLGLALAQPAWLVERPAREWTLVLGTGPAGDLPSGSRTRLEAAVAAGLAFAREAGAGDRFRWVGPSVFEGAGGEAPGPEFLAEILAAGPRSWARWDVEDALWLPVSGDAPEPLRAGVRRAALEAVPGPVARTDAGEWSWAGGDEDELVRVERGAEATVTVRGAAWAPGEPMRAVAEAWAGARGARVVPWDELTTQPVLRLSGPVTGSGGAPVSAGRDGWLARVTPGALAAGSGLGMRPLLRAGGRSLASGAPGRVELGFVHLEDLEGDPAAFAVSWAELFDALVLEPPGVVALPERRAAQPLERAPAGARELNIMQRWPMGAPLALLAGLCILVGLRR